MFCHADPRAGRQLLLMFVGWEGVGLCSYLLIGFYLDLKEAGDAAKKAFITKPRRRLGLCDGNHAPFLITQAPDMHRSASLISPRPV